MINFHAKYTVVLLEIMKDPHCNNAIIDALSDYPIYTGKKSYDLIPTREQLNEKILNHYKYREIGFETVGRFIDELKITMNEIMPYYNELFKTIEIMSDIEDPFGNVDITETFEEERADSSSGENSSEVSVSGESEQNVNTSESVDSTITGNTVKERRFQDTPQNNIADINEYLTDYTKENETTDSEGNTDTTVTGKTTDSTTGTTSSTASGSNESSGTTKHTLHRKGNHGVNTYAHDMNEFRETIIDVVDRIIHDKRLAELFMLVW